METDQWLVGWREIGKYLGKSAKTAQRYARDGMPVFRDPGRRPIARKDQIDKYLVELNREMNHDGCWKGSGIEEAIEMIDEQGRKEKEFEERLIDAHRTHRSRY
jgi:hypothetical protein